MGVFGLGIRIVSGGFGFGSRVSLVGWSCAATGLVGDVDVGERVSLWLVGCSLQSCSALL